MSLRIKIFFCCAFIIASIVFAAGYFYSKITCPIHSQNPLVFRVDKTTSAKSFVHLLKKENFIHSEALLLAWIRFRGLSTQLQAGIYEVKPGESVLQLLQRVVHGDVLKEPLQIIEGTTWRQLDTNLSQAPYLVYRQNDWQSVHAEELPGTPHGINGVPQEGLLLADTYQYRAGSSASEVLMLAHQQLKQYLLQAWGERLSGLPYQTPYELLIVASILEKESALSSERCLISGVIVNRLAKRMPLQMDPTVIYGLGLAYHGTLSHADLQYDSPYNTYRYRGLPPTPIAMVSRDSINQAAKPCKTKALYFVAKGDGTHVFSETYEAQRQAIQLYLKEHK